MKKTAYAVIYGQLVLAGSFKHPGAYATFSTEEEAIRYADELNDVRHGYKVEQVEIKVIKRKVK